MKYYLDIKRCGNERSGVNLSRNVFDRTVRCIEVEHYR